MPVYEFECKKCKNAYEELTTFDGEKNVKCPQCGSKSKIKLPPSRFGFNFTNPIGTDRWNNSHDYRYQHSGLPNAKAQRAAAEKASHMGTAPYNEIDDLNKGDYFGEVK